MMEHFILVNGDTNFHKPRKMSGESEQVNTSRLMNNG